MQLFVADKKKTPNQVHLPLKIPPNIFNNPYINQKGHMREPFSIPDRGSKFMVKNEVCIVDAVMISFTFVFQFRFIALTSYRSSIFDLDWFVKVEPCFLSQKHSTVLQL